MSESPHVVIVGGGFGGLTAARGFAGAPVRVTLIDRRNYHLFQPFLYQVATAALSPGDIAYPIRWIVRRQKNTRVILAEVVSVDAARHRLILEDGEIGYDRLILAAGASHSYFGHDAWEPDAPGLKTLEDALEIRRRVLLAFEKAERETDESERAALLTFVVVGGGPTGVELAGSLAEIFRHTLARDFRSFDPRTARAILIEGAPRILTAYPETLSASARDQLIRLGVEVRTSCTLEEIVPGQGIRVKQVTITPGSAATKSAATGSATANKAAPDIAATNGDPAGSTARSAPQGAPPASDWIATRNVLWAAGVAASPLARSLGSPLDRAGRVLVEPDLTVPGHPEIQVIGDLAAFVHQTGKALPGVAPVAIQQGRASARNVLRSLRGEPPTPFHYRDKGNLATIGRSAAVADFGWLRLSGFFAWVAWCLVHIFFLIGFRNRLIVMFEWAWAYFTRQRGVRLITDSFPEEERRPRDP